MPSALLDTLLLHGKQTIPPFLYNSAGKEERTATLVYQAIISGYKAVDTAALPKHCREDLVGAGVRRALSEGKISRHEMYIQSKFASVDRQDPNKMPYDPTASISEQVHTSIGSSLRNMRPSKEKSSSESTYLDCLVLHTPLPTMAQTLEAWRAAESYVPHKIRYLGVSFVTRGILEQLYGAADIKPAVVLNQFSPNTHSDLDVRAFCFERSIIYQTFWRTSANRKLFNNPEVRYLADKVGLPLYSSVYVLLSALENLVMIHGPTRAREILHDFSCVQTAREWALEHPKDWAQCLDNFKKLLGETITSF